MKKIYQMVHTYSFDKNGKVQTQKSSFGSLAKAIENAEMWINKSEGWIDTTAKHIDIINKETGEILWTWEEGK